VIEIVPRLVALISAVTVTAGLIAGAGNASNVSSAAANNAFTGGASGLGGRPGTRLVATGHLWAHLYSPARARLAAGVHPGGRSSASGGQSAHHGKGGGGGGGTGSPPPGRPPRCYTGPWQVKPLGTGSIRPGDPKGVYLDESGGTFLLVVTHSGGRAMNFSGTVTTDGTLLVQPFRFELDDNFTVSPDGHTVTWQFLNYGALDGLSITPVCGGHLTIAAQVGIHTAPLRGPAFSGDRRPLFGPVTITRSS
jgi:hypothetical protein